MLLPPADFLKQGRDKIMGGMLDCYVRLIGKGAYVECGHYFRVPHLKYLPTILEFSSLCDRAHLLYKMQKIFIVRGPFAAGEWVHILEGYPWVWVGPCCIQSVDGGIW